MIKSKKLSKFLNVKHGFFNKKGGKSKGIYNSLNCGIGSKDSKKNIDSNLKIVGKKIGVLSKKIFLLHQIHSNKFYFIKDSKYYSKKIKADALITESRNIAIGVLTADCVPILLYDKNKKIISAIHAGWKGAYKDIIKNVLKFLLNRGCKPSDITAVIGPCISKKNYEVKKDFINKFIKKDKKNKKFFVKINKKTYFSLNSYIKYQLESLHIKNIEIIKKDTFNPKNNFFSARRSLKKNNDYGRNISIIMIK